MSDYWNQSRYSGGSRISHRGRGPLGGHGPLTWALFGKMFARTKELGPVGGVHLAHPLDLPMHYSIIGSGLLTTYVHGYCHGCQKL